jgi:FKBP-type peptidyl-prolyl cis-trans isomerase
MQALTLFVAVVIMLLSVASAFRGRGSAQVQARRLLSLRAGAVSDADKPFYALGVNVARQVGGELKGILSPDEINAMLTGFSDSMTSKLDSAAEVKMLQEFGPKLNEILTARASLAVDSEKKKGKDFISSFLLKSPRAVVTPSGLVYNEIIAGTGPQPTPA